MNVKKTKVMLINQLVGQQGMGKNNTLDIVEGYTYKGQTISEGPAYEEEN